MSLSDLPSILWAVFLVILFFGGTIFIHELGHFLAARWRGMKVERFSIGFGPKIFAWRGKDGVEYRLSWLPLGGYVALPQLADMSAIEGKASTDVAALPPPSYSTRVIVSAAGATFNILFALVLGCIVWKIGEPSSSALSTTTIAEISPELQNLEGKTVPSPASLAGLRVGDTIVKIDGHPVRWFGEIVERMKMSSTWSASGERVTVFTIQRGNDIFDLTLNPILTSATDRRRTVGFSPTSKMVIAKPASGSMAEKAGLNENDQIIAVNGTPVLTMYRLAEALKARAGKAITITVQRGANQPVITIPEPAKNTGSEDLGISLKSGIIFTHPTPFQQVSNAASRTVEVLGKLINPRSDVRLSDMQSPIGIIGNYYDLAKEGMPFVLWFTIIINVNLAIFNMLPIPVLDGGHILFATIGKLRGRALPPNFVASTQSVFMLLLFSMMIYIGFFDVRRRMNQTRPEPKPTQSAPAQPAEPAPATP